MYILKNWEWECGMGYCQNYPYPRIHVSPYYETKMENVPKTRLTLIFYPEPLDDNLSVKRKKEKGKVFTILLFAKKIKVR